MSTTLRSFFFGGVCCLLAVLVGQGLLSSHLDAAQQAWDSGDYALAARRALSVASEHPAHSQGALRLAARSYVKLEQWNDAEHCFRQVSSLSPEDEKLRGQTLFALGQYEASLSVWKHLLASDPKDVQTLQNLVAVLLLLEKDEQALSHAQTLQRVAPESIDGFVFAGMIEYDRGNVRGASKEFSEAIRLSKTLENSPVDPASIYEWYADSLLLKGEAKEAAEWAKRSTQLKQQPRSFHILGMALALQGKSEHAEQAWRKALQLDPQFYDAHVELGRLALSQKRPNDARFHFESVLKEDPKNPDANYGLKQANRHLDHLANRAAE